MSLPPAVSPDSRELIFGKDAYAYETDAFEWLQRSFTLYLSVLGYLVRGLLRKILSQNS